MTWKKNKTAYFTDEQCNTINWLQTSLADRGMEVDDRLMMKLILTTGIRVLELKINRNINVFDTLLDERDEETDN